MLELSPKLRMLQQGPSAPSHRCHDLRRRVHLLPTLLGRCPNCGGQAVATPIRPAEKLARYPASTVRVVKPDDCAAAKCGAASARASSDRGWNGGLPSTQMMTATDTPSAGLGGHAHARNVRPRACHREVRDPSARRGNPALRSIRLPVLAAVALREQDV